MKSKIPINYFLKIVCLVGGGGEKEIAAVITVQQEI